MSSDYAEKEREFLDTLAADTGRDLDGWMAAIAGTGLTHRDDIIDWLRQRRFTFDRASWLERIHNNGGRPIYADRPDLKTLVAGTSEPPAKVQRPAVASQPSAPPAPVRQAASPSPERSTDALGLEALLAKGKAFRPLAQHLLKAIETAHPGVAASARGALIVLGLPVEFAVLAVSAKDVKLGLAMGDAATRPGLETARITSAPPTVTHMVTLTDVRRIDAALLAYIAEAAARARPPPA